MASAGRCGTSSEWKPSIDGRWKSSHYESHVTGDGFIVTGAESTIRFMTNPLITRPATTEDAPAVVALVNSAFRGESSKAGWTTEAVCSTVSGPISKR